MSLFPDPTISDMLAVQRNFEALARLLFVGVGSPEGVVRAGPAIYLNESGGVGSTLWVKRTSNASATGWLAVA